MRRRRGDVAEKKCDVTIGEYIEAVREKSLLRPATTESYAVALRDDRRRDHRAREQGPHRERDQTALDYR